VVAVAQQAAAAVAAMGLGSAQEFMNAPLRLQTESYEAFSRRILSLGQEEGAERTTAEEELRKLQIDPAVFYRGSKRVDLCRFSYDDHDPASSSSAAAVGAGVAAAAEAAAGGVCIRGGSPLAEAELPESEGGTWLSGGNIFAPPARSGEKGAASNDWEGASPKQAPQMSSLNVPQFGDEIEDLPYEELVDTAEGETRGGRMSHETPKGIEGILQVDSLTDEGDDDDPFREELLEAPEPSPGEEHEGDAVEAFELDNAFDYDNVDNLTSKVGLLDTGALAR